MLDQVSTVAENKTSRGVEKVESKNTENKLESNTTAINGHSLHEKSSDVANSSAANNVFSEALTVNLTGTGIGAKTVDNANQSSTTLNSNLSTPHDSRLNPDTSTDAGNGIEISFSSTESSFKATNSSNDKPQTTESSVPNQKNISIPNETEAETSTSEIPATAESTKPKEQAESSAEPETTSTSAASTTSGGINEKFVVGDLIDRPSNSSNTSSNSSVESSRTAVIGV